MAIVGGERPEDLDAAFRPEAGRSRARSRRVGPGATRSAARVAGSVIVARRTGPIGGAPSPDLLGRGWTGFGRAVNVAVVRLLHRLRRLETQGPAPLRSNRYYPHPRSPPGRARRLCDSVARVVAERERQLLHDPAGPRGEPWPFRDARGPRASGGVGGGRFAAARTVDEPLRDIAPALRTTPRQLGGAEEDPDRPAYDTGAYPRTRRGVGVDRAVTRGALARAGHARKAPSGGIELSNAKGADIVVPGAAEGRGSRGAARPPRASCRGFFARARRCPGRVDLGRFLGARADRTAAGRPGHGPA